MTTLSCASAGQPADRRLRHVLDRRRHPAGPFSLTAALAVLLAVSSGAALCAASSVSQLRISCQQIDTSGYPEIRCYFTVAEGAKPIIGLTQREISLILDGAPHTSFTLRSVGDEGSHIAVALAVDTSGSMKGVPLKDAKAAAAEFLGRLSEADQVAVITFGGRPRVVCNSTTDHRAATQAIESPAARGDTALYDAIVLAARETGSQSAPRKALVVLTDGKDTESKATKDGALAQVRSAGVPVYAIGLGPAVNRAVLEALAKESGGAAFFAATSGDLLGIYQGIAQELSRQYVLAFQTPGVAHGPWHEAVLQVRYAGQTARAGKRYLEVNAPDRPVPQQGAMSHLYVALLAIAGLDLVLAVGWVVRRSRRAQQGG